MYIKEKFDRIKDIKEYVNNGKKFYYDPYRNILIPVTPEEKVRQKAAKFFERNLKVPAGSIKTEDHLHHYEGATDNGRMDIVILCNDNGRQVPLAVVECKAESVPLSYQVLDQAANYADIVWADYIFITNGIEMQQYKYNYEKEIYELISGLADYDEMLNGKGEACIYDDNFERCGYDELFDIEASRKYGYDYCFIEEDTPDILVPHIVNMYEGLMDLEHKLRGFSSEYYELTDDLGCRFLCYGDPSGSTFGTGWYRAFMIKERNGNSKIVNIGIMATGRSENDPKYGNRTGKSVLVVSVSDEKKDEMLLQINLNTFLHVNDGMLKLTHSGVSKRRGARIEKLKELIKECAPYLIQNDDIVLGRFSGKDLIYVDNEDFTEVIKNIITYALIRNEYYNKLKNR